jgi:thymidylate kinase
VRLGLYALDALSTRKQVRKALASDADFIIFDRYIYDQFANLRLRNRFVRAYVRWLMTIVPRPDISYILDADPLQARTRKPEYPLDFIYINRRAYLDLVDMIGGMTVIPAGPVQQMRADVLRHAFRALGFESASHEQDEAESLQRAS